MIDASDQWRYWQDGAAQGRWEGKDGYGPPLIPTAEDLSFVEPYLKPGGRALVLGATPQLCELALARGCAVTSVDFSPNVIEALRRDGVTYISEDWLEFFNHTTQLFNTIVTDGGLGCLEFPGVWQQMARQIHAHLAPGGAFVARIYTNRDKPPTNSQGNRNVGRFIASMMLATRATKWMMHPLHHDYDAYPNLRHAFPSEKSIRQIFGRVFGRLALAGPSVPSYEAGEHFPTYAWRRS